MNNLAKFFIAAAVVIFAFILFEQPVQENEILIEEKPSGQVLPQENLLESTPDYNIFSRPRDGISTFIGEPIQSFEATYGKPDRIEPSVFGYEWHIYKLSPRAFHMVGVEDGRINQIYATGDDVKVTPYQIGQSVEDIYRFTIVLPEIGLQLEENYYVFSLTPTDTKRRILVQYDELFAQLYIDTFDNELEGVRFIDPQTLILHRSYDIYYEGEIIDTVLPASSIQSAVNRAAERELTDLTNLYRLQHGVEPLNIHAGLQTIAREFSEELAKSETGDVENFELSKYEDKLQEFEIEFTKAGGNSAALYKDPIEAINGWMNSREHRETILEPSYTHLGIGVFSQYYTQNFIEFPDEEVE